MANQSRASSLRTVVSIAFNIGTTEADELIRFWYDNRTMNTVAFMQNLTLFLGSRGYLSHLHADKILIFWVSLDALIGDEDQRIEAAIDDQRRFVVRKRDQGEKQSEAKTDVRNPDSRDGVDAYQGKRDAERDREAMRAAGAYQGARDAAYDLAALEALPRTTSTSTGTGPAIP